MFTTENTVTTEYLCKSKDLKIQIYPLTFLEINLPMEDSGTIIMLNYFPISNE